MKLIALALSIMMSLFLVSCGAGDGSLKGKELAQGVDLVIYTLDRADLEVAVEYFSGSREEGRKTIHYGDGDAQDDVRKILDKDRFVLVMNDQKATIDISPDNGEMNYQGNIHNAVKGCRLDGTSRLRGNASHSKFDLSWEMNVELRGDGCTDNMKDQYFGFYEAEVNKLNMHSVRDLFESLDHDMGDSRKIRVKLRIIGATG
jgi:hypothetical protein